MRSFLSRLGLVGAVALALSGCNGAGGSIVGSSAPPNNTSSNSSGSTGGLVLNNGGGGVALVRFLNGSPDTATADVCVNGVRVATSLAYKSFAPGANTTGAASYLVIVAGGIADTISFAAGGAGCGGALLTSGAVTPGTNTRTTVVLSGKSTSAPATVGVSAFSETAIVPSTAQASGGPFTQFFNASPAAGALFFGYFPYPFSALPAAAVPASLSANAVAAKAASALISVPPIAANGIGFYSGVATATTVTAELFPGKAPAVTLAPCLNSNGVDAANVNNVLPFSTDVILDQFAIDTPTGSTAPFQVIGAYSPNGLGF